MTTQQADDFMRGYASRCAETEVDIWDAFETLDITNALEEMQVVSIVGSAGKTTVATLLHEILRAASAPMLPEEYAELDEAERAEKAALRTVDKEKLGAYFGGVSPLSERILIAGKPVAAACYQQAILAVVKVQGNCTRAMAEFLVACLCFAQSGCTLAVVELADSDFAAPLPELLACGITHIGADGAQADVVQFAQHAARVLRADVPTVLSPAQPEAALEALRAEAERIGCTLTLPSLDDFTEKHSRRLQNRVDYGGYEVMLPYFGEHAAHNMAIAVELALAIWRKGWDVSDEAILEGLSVAENVGAQAVLRRKPLLIADACHTPLQAASLARTLQEMDFEAVSAVVAFTEVQTVEGALSLPRQQETFLADDEEPEDILEQTDLGAFFTALETGVVVNNSNITKELMPGMADNPIDKLYAFTLEKSILGEGDVSIPAQTIVAYGKFHFEVIACDSFAEALARADADENEGVVLCGSPYVAMLAQNLPEQE